MSTTFDPFVQPLESRKLLSVSILTRHVAPSASPASCTVNANATANPARLVRKHSVGETSDGANDTETDDDTTGSGGESDAGDAEDGSENEGSNDGNNGQGGAAGDENDAGEADDDASGSTVTPPGGAVGTAPVVTSTGVFSNTPIQSTTAASKAAAKKAAKVAKAEARAQRRAERAQRHAAQLQTRHAQTAHVQTADDNETADDDGPTGAGQETEDLQDATPDRPEASSAARL